jgi:DNA-binding SARP family transcriptional activator
VQVRLLGPVEIAVNGGSLPVPGLRRRTVLAVLALRGGEIVSTDELVEVVWGDAAPSTATNTLQRHVSYLREVLGNKAAIALRPPGYVLAMAGEATDVEGAERLIRQGTQAHDHADRVRHLRAALALWRGRSLADVAGPAWLDRQAERLDQLRRHADAALIESRLALGEHAEVVPDLERLTREHPGDEQFHEQLMLALYRTGRPVDALAAYSRLSRSLGDASGLSPSPALRELEAAIARQDPGLDQYPSTITVTGPAAPVPMQLPPATNAFAGRRDQLAALDAIVPGQASDEPAAVVISAVSGTAGVGKTALAVHWAHRVGAQFPDGHLYVNLRGFDPAAAALDPTEAVRGFLDALGVPPEQIPPRPDARTALYRSLLAGKRILVVLDNARDAEQVRPLLPGSAGCVAIVTSRNQLMPLVAAEGAHLLALDLLSDAEAGELLGRRLGADRIAAEPLAVAEIIAWCARLPLALAIVAARAASRPGFALGVLAGELRATADRLDAFHGGDAGTDVRAVFSWSTDALSPDAARLFRLLGLHPGPDITAPAAASLVGVALPRVRALLTELTGANLLTEHLPGRYTFHDLLRAYAAEQADGADRAAERHAATHRMLDHYLHTADAAALMLYPLRERVHLDPPQPGACAKALADDAQSLAWFAAERAVLVALVELAADAGFDTHTWQLARSLANFLDGEGRWHDIIASQHAALAAATRLTDRPAQAAAHRRLAGAHVRLGHGAEARTDLERAIELYEELGDLAGQGNSHHYFCMLWESQGRYPEALRHAHRSLELYRAVGNRSGVAAAQNAVGWCHGQLGDYQQALTHCLQALATQQEIDDRDGAAETMDSIAYAHHQLGHHTEAVSYYQQALAHFRQCGDRYSVAEALNSLGDVHRAVLDTDAARTAWEQARDIFDELEHPDAAEVRDKLEGLEPATAEDDAALGDHGYLSATCARQGQLWRIECGQRTILVPHSVGMLHLAVLLANPGQEIPAIELAAGVAALHDAVANTAHQPVLDAVAIRDYRKRIDELRERIEDLEAENRPERAAEARAEQDWLIAELAAATGLGGRARGFADNQERARAAVGRAIRRTLGTITRADASIGEHLRKGISTGNRCSYRPA